MGERIGGSAIGADLGIEIDELLPRQVHQDQRVKVDVGFLRDGRASSAGMSIVKMETKVCPFRVRIQGGGKAIYWTLVQ
jgi:hypothetical protein